MTKYAIMLWLAHQGVDHAHADAMLRLLWREGGGQHCITSPRGTYHGAFQWAADRWRKALYFTYTKPGRCPPMQEQLSFALAELSAPPYNVFWRAHGAATYDVLLKCFGFGSC